MSSLLAARSRLNAARDLVSLSSSYPFTPILLVASLLACGVQSAYATQAPVMPADENTQAGKTGKPASFDLSLLKSRGIDPKVAEYFRNAPRFAEGVRRVSVSVNGLPRGTVDARFDSRGDLCFTLALLKQANLKVPEPELFEEGCYNFVASFPQTEIMLHPSREEVALVVTPDSLLPVVEEAGVYQSGGVGGLINYSLQGMTSESYGQSRSYYSGNTELGFNAGNWMVRSRQTYTAQGDRRDFRTLYTYAQKTLVQSKSLLQVGEINTQNSALPGVAITGFQVLPEDALQSTERGGATVEGIAQSQARVEIRQAGTLIHSTLVPAGPFSLPGIQLLKGNTDLDVSVIETNGERRSFVVPAASLSQFTYSAPGYSVAAGKMRTFDAKGMQSPMLVTASSGWLISPANMLSAGLMLSDNDYQAGAWTLDSRLSADSTVSLRSTVSKSGKQGLKGAEFSVAASTRLTENLSASANITRRTADYHGLQESTRSTRNTASTVGQHKRDASLNQYGLSLGWSDPVLGSFSTGYTASTSANGSKSGHLSGQWSKSFEKFSVSANIEKSTSSSRGSRHGSYGSSSESQAVYLSVNIPFGGGRSARSYASKRDGVTRFGAGYSDSSNELASYNLSAERNARDNREDFSGSVNMLPRYANVNLGYSQSGSDSSSYSGTVSGGIALHKDGVTLSPYALRDTFAVASVGGVSGVKLSTPSGPVWTDPWGRAVVAQLPAYKKSTVEIATKSLPRNIDIQNGHKSVSVGRGSVPTLDFAVTESRRVLLRLKDASGNPLPKGATVFNADNQVVNTITDGSKVFLSNGNLEKSLTVKLAADQRCAVKFTLPEKAVNPDAYFEKAEGVCTPI